jgi:hypothetical protein
MATNFNIRAHPRVMFVASEYKSALETRCTHLFHFLHVPSINRPQNMALSKITLALSQLGIKAK